MPTPKEASFRCKINDWYDIHDGYWLQLRPGYTAIVGPNGAGKTTLLHQIEKAAEQRKYLTFYYSNLESGADRAKQAWLQAGDMKSLATSACSSEGENITLAFGDAVYKIGAIVRQSIKTGTPLVILLDALDSGSSIDRIREIRNLFDMILKDAGVLTHDHPERGLYILAAANAYELAAGAICLDPRTGKTRTFKDYVEYANFVCSYFDDHKKENNP